MSAIIGKAKSVLGGGSPKHTVQCGPFEISETGFGLMGLTWRSPPAPMDEALATMKAALDEGANFWNGGVFYGTPEYNSLHVLKEYFIRYPEDRDKVVISIKGGVGPHGGQPDGTPESLRAEVEHCIEALGGKSLDLFEMARVDAKTPIEISVATLDQLVKEGKLGGISLSECSAETIRRAAKVAKISAVEVEVSMWATEIFENDVAKACAENDIVVVAYSPLGRGFLTGAIRKPEDIPESDMRRRMPRFQPGAFEKNVDLLHELDAVAKKKGASPGQTGLAWLRAQAKKPGMPAIVPIPGSSSPERVRENMGIVELSDADVKELDAIVESATVEGTRYPAFLEHLNFGNSRPLEPGEMEAAFTRK